MNCQSIKSKIDNKGFSLVEVLASIVLISMIIGPFFSMFIQSTLTNKVASKISDATFIAQSEMEKMYHLSQTETFPSTLGFLNTNDEKITYQNETGYGKTTQGYYVFLSLTKQQSDSSLVNVVIRVFNSRSMKIMKAQMENKLIWK